jgi:D-alanyl-D-alanine carboxypeptidase (penicillin-binding protein 5/6)
MLQGKAISLHTKIWGVNLMRKFLKKRLAYLIITMAIAVNLVPAAAMASPVPDAFDIKAQSAMLIDADTGRILYQKNPDEALAPASMTKMMTEYLVLDAIHSGQIKWDQMTNISTYVYKLSQRTDLSNVPLRADYQYSVKELYQSMAIYSSNSSAIALAELIAGSETNFIKMMNDKAKELGLKNYKFVNCSGLNNSDLLGMQPQGTGVNDENQMSARDTATLAFRLLHDHPEVLDTSSVPMMVFREGTPDAIRMDNWNWMIPGTMYPYFDYPGVDGLKTGHTALGGFSFTATAKRNGMRLISIVMKTKSKEARFTETKKLLDYGFSNYTAKELYPAGYSIKDQPALPVYKGKSKTVKVVTQQPLVAAVKPGEENSFVPFYEVDKSLVNEDGQLAAPLTKGQIVGSMGVKYTGADNYGFIVNTGKNKVTLVTAEPVKKAGWFTLLIRSIGDFFANFFKN